MRKNRLAFLLLTGVLAGTLAAVQVTPAPAAAGALDGKSFAGRIGEKGKEPGDADTFVFAAGSFRSVACGEWGFGSAPYTTKKSKKKPGVLVFRATTSSDEEGTMAWKGKVRGQKIRGTVQWTKDGKTSEWWFKGSLAAD